MNAGEVIVPVVIFLVIFGIFYLYYSSRNKERMALIEKGAEKNRIHAKTNSNNDSTTVNFVLGELPY